jgi:glycosyltransferase involved in cell wall biosynthesis
LVIIKQGLPQNNFSLNNNSISGNQLKLIYIGRITFEKGLHILIDAVSTFKEHQIELDIYGQSTDFKYESDLKLKSLHLKNVKWKGILKKEEVQSTIINYDFLCLCSNFSEMSPLVIQEAFSVGVPVIASNVYGNAEQINNGYNGLLFQNNNVNSLREALNKCIHNRNLRMNLSSNISTPRKFDSVANEHISLYTSLMN